ncbi:hypothetical protein GCM10023116_34900 [Kistimonas scapharcae]|uniref:PilY1 beta-propeller domain-containing protein n=1 Tax=Kistimonas scapharcae TaxID=1036133 RepID=A0ABP8V5P3_9GAMM
MMLAAIQGARRYLYLSVGGVLFSGYVSATDLMIAQKPLFLVEASASNVIMMLDDSGSMNWRKLWQPAWNLCAYRNEGSNSVSSTKAPFQTQDNVCFYEDPNYRGTERCYANDETVLPNVETRSFRLRPGFGIRAYSGTNHTGDDWDSGRNTPGTSEFIRSFELYTTTENVADAECGAFNNTTISSRASENQDQDFAHFAGDGSGNIGDWRGYTPDMEASFYDATVTYTPWADMSDANFRQARNHPVSGEADYTVLTDLVDRFYVVAEDTAGFTGDRPRRYGQINYERVPNRHIDWWDDHTIFQLRADRVRSWTVTFEYRDGPLGPEVIQRIEQNVDITDPAEVAKRQQNYANWYQYYRNRMFSVVASATKIVDSFPSVRYALGYINKSNLIVDFPETQFGNATHNEKIIDELIKRSRGSGGTPLPAALHRAGQSYRRTGTGAPIISECQLNYTMLLTDGDWSGAESAISDLDADTRSGWLSDVALHHYENDLRIDLKDEVPLGDNNTNKKQHMSVIGIAFGQIGSLVDTDDDGWPDPPLKKTDDWGSNKFDDLWHASFNSGGAYFSARNYFSLLTQLNDVFQNIINVTSSVAQLAIGSTSRQTDRRIFQARFDSQDWAGDLVAIHIDGNGKVVNNPDGSMRNDWSARSRLAALGSTGHTRRVIITRKRTAGGTTEGSPFTNAAGNTELYDALNVSSGRRVPVDLSTSTASSDAYRHEVLDYIRGNQTFEGENGFRQRSSRMGDVVNSSPVYVGYPNFQYPDSIAAGSLYSDFKKTHKGRSPMVYVGANDGMLHGFDASTGDEKLGYVSPVLFPNLHELVLPHYPHRFYVDANPNAVDAFFYTNIGRTDGVWKTVLIGGLGAGGKAIYALDVTDPSQFSEANAKNIALWEFTPGNDDDLGYTFGKPMVTKLASGDWVAIFGNGYNSTEGNASASGEAVLYVVDIRNGKLIKKISTKSGDTTKPNGLSSIAAVDTDGDFVTDLVYAGDLNGDLWKFDFKSRNVSDWKVAFGNSGKPRPLFSARLSSPDLKRPITGTPTIGRHPVKGYLVYFGTGRYFAEGDNARKGQDTQSVYAIWDKDDSSSVTSSVSDSDLLEQKITTEFEVEVKSKDVALRQTTANAIDWDTHKGWKMDLILQQSGVTNFNNGERVVVQAALRNGNVIFLTQMPTGGLCESGGDSWIMEVNAYSGARLEENIFDINDDGEFDEKDSSYSSLGMTLNPSDPNYPTDNIVATGIKNEGIVQQPTIIPCQSSECKLMTGAGGSINTIHENDGQQTTGRQSWRQILLEE